MLSRRLAIVISVFTHAQTILRMTTAANARLLCVIACVCLLLIAAALRFYNITDQTLRYDEAKVALNSAGGFSEVVDNTRYENSSPILYPIALWAVQKASSTEFSVRFMPAAASVLTVAALLLLMPRMGVARRAAVLAALLAALSAAAVVHAQDAREYSVDALAAALIIAGLLGYLRDGKKALLCAALAAGPLLQYGLALFGVAALAAAALAPAARDAAVGVGGTQSYAAAIWGRLRGRADLLLPIACFGAACALSWWVTLRYQWTDGGWGSGAYLTDYYYQGGFDAAAIAQFAVGRTWDLLSYHMPTAIAAGALLCFALLLPWALRRRRMDGIALLALFAVGAAICAALMNAYPLGDIRQCLYLGPIIFLAAGSAFDTVAGAAAARARRAGLAPAMAVVAAVGVAIAGASDLWRHYEAHRSAEGIERIFAALEEREREGDAVYVSRWGVPLVAFYKDEKPDNYYYSKTFCWEPSGGECVSEMFDELFLAFGDSRRIWLINSPQISAAKEMSAYSQEVEVEEVAANGSAALHLLTRRVRLGGGVHEEASDMDEGGRFGPLTAAAVYDIYIQGAALHYVKQPCAAEDIEARFFLHLYPGDAADLSGDDRQRGFANRDFVFQDYGIRDGDKCVIRRELPDYAIDRIHTGQFIHSDGPVSWETDFPVESFDLGELIGMYEEVVSGQLSAASTYDVYLKENALHYVKQFCAPSDVDARFFLHIYPEDAADLLGNQMQNGYDNFDFYFHGYGIRADDRCIIRRELPDYAIDRIHTGQYIYPDGPITWEVEFPFEPFDLSEWLGMYEEVVSAAPRAASTYNVYLKDNALHYAKQPCAPGDTDAHFFLNIYPEDEADLPERRRQYVHDILNFDFRDYGLIAGDRCLIRRELPAYPVKHIHTGQYVYPDGPIVWEVEFPFRP